MEKNECSVLPIPFPLIQTLKQGNGLSIPSIKTLNSQTKKGRNILKLFFFIPFHFIPSSPLKRGLKVAATAYVFTSPHDMKVY